MAIFNVKTYGALGNGVNDDTSAIQAAINAAKAAGGGDVYMPTGTYIVTGNNIMNSTGAIRLLNNVNLYGDGMGDTTIKVSDNWSGEKITGVIRTPFGVENHDISLRDLTIDGNRAETSGKTDGFFCGTAPGSIKQDRNITVERVEIKNCSGYGFDPHEQTVNLTIKDCVSHHNGLDGFTLDYQINGLIENNVAYQNDRHGFNVCTTTHDLLLNNNISYQNKGAGIVVQRGSENLPWPSGITIQGGSIWGNLKEGVLIKMSDNVTLKNTDIFNNGQNGVRIYGATNNKIQNNDIYNNSRDGNNKYDEVRIQDYPDSVTGNTYSSHHNEISGNNIYEDTLIKARNGVYENNDSSDFNKVFGNTITGVASQPVVITGEHSTTDAGSGGGGGTVPGGVNGTDLADLLTGTENADTILGLKGNDTINGNGGNDTLDGGSESDTVHGNNGNDSIYGGSGMDTLFGDADNDYLNGGSENDSMDGGDGLDTLEGGTGNDSMLGGLGEDYIDGNDGNDTINGGDGKDTIEGGIGNDRVSAGAADDQAQGEGGKDTLFGEDGADLLLGGLDNDSLGGGNGNDTLLGGEHNDTMNGDADQDFMSGDTGDDSLKGGAGNDTVDGGDGTDTVKGDDGADLIYGGAGNDRLEGNGQNDTLIGGAGNDVLRGGSEKDWFYFDTGSGVDFIEDFSKTNDKIQIESNIYATAAEALTHVTYANGDAIIDFGGGNFVTLDLITSGLTASHFEIV